MVHASQSSQFGGDKGSYKNPLQSYDREGGYQGPSSGKWRILPFLKYDSVYDGPSNIASPSNSSQDAQI